MEKKLFKRMLFGGDYNPNQYEEELWTEDIRILEKASINSATINVFSWSKIQPNENEYDFSYLDKVIKMLSENDYDIVLATSTASLPAWMYQKYPEVGRIDFEGRRHKFGQRHNACPNSPIYQKYSEKMASELAERYGNHKNIVCWHINNEYSGECFCPHCEKEFRVWLQKKYKTIEKLNKAWNMEFWGHLVYDWDEIVLPNILSESINYEDTAFAGISLDYRRFMSDSLLKNFITEKQAIREIDKNTPITTNLMGTYKYLDSFKWAKEMDIVSWDHYPSFDTPKSFSAMSHDLMRGLKDGQPFMLMEQTPSQQNWQPYNSLKKPGEVRCLSYQAVAHGSDTVQFFQLRRSVGGCEKFHGAVISHVGHENTRVFNEVATIGKELKELSDTIIGARSDNKIGIVFDWDNYWALEYTSGPNRDLKYLSQIHQYYDVLYQENYTVDMIRIEADFGQYDLVIAPVLYMMKGFLKEKIETYIQNGGNFVSTFMSGIVNETDNVYLGGYPGPLRKAAGVWVEEIDALAPNQYNTLSLDNQDYQCNLLCDIIHLEGAESIANYTSNFYKDTPVITKNNFGKGTFWYVGSQIEETGLRKLIKKIASDIKVNPITKEKNTLEITKRVKENIPYYFIINWNEECALPQEFVGKLDLLTNTIMSSKMKIAQYDVLILK